MKIYTKTGDKGSTSLLSGRRVPKFHDRIEAYGTVDELNSHIGLLRTYGGVADEHKKLLFSIQNKLFNIGSSLAMDEEPQGFTIPEVTAEDIVEMEKAMDLIESELPPLRNFILPGNTTPEAQSHVCRCVCRRAERLVVYIAQTESVHDLIPMYLNRLSDYLFMLARKISFDAGHTETTWQS